MLSAGSPQPFQLWLPKVPWPRQGSPRPTNNMRFGPRNPESQNFYTHNFHFCNISIFCKKSWFFPFTRTCMSCAMLSLSDKMSPRFFVPKTFLDGWTTLWWLSDKLTSVWLLPRASCFDCSHPRWLYMMWRCTPEMSFSCFYLSTSSLGFSFVWRHIRQLDRKVSKTAFKTLRRPCST